MLNKIWFFRNFYYLLSVIKYQNTPPQMESSLHTNDIFVSSTVYDMMVIEVNNRLLQTKQLHYQIQDAAKKILRKGSFTGCSIQLRLNTLFEGDYTLILEQEKEYLFTTHFKKCNEDDLSEHHYPYYKLNAV